MNRGKIRAQVMDWLHDSRLGWIGWLVDSAAWLGCRYAGHQPFVNAPERCRHCGTPMPHRAHVATEGIDKAIFVFCSCQQEQYFPYNTANGRKIAEQLATLSARRHVQDPATFPLGSDIKPGSRR